MGRRVVAAVVDGGDAGLPDEVGRVARRPTAGRGHRLAGEVGIREAQGAGDAFVGRDLVRLGQAVDPRVDRRAGLAGDVLGKGDELVADLVEARFRVMAARAADQAGCDAVVVVAGVDLADEQ